MAVEILRPNGIGNEASLTPSPEVDNYLNVDEETKDDDTTYNYSTGTLEEIADSLALPSSSINNGVINKVTVKAYLKSTTTNDMFYLGLSHIVLGGGADGDAFSLLQGGIYELASVEFTQITVDGTPRAWEWSDFSDLEVYIITAPNSEDNTLSVTQIWIEIDYTPTPLLETLTDNFNDNSLDEAKWDGSYYEEGISTVSEVNNQIELAFTNPVGYSEVRLVSVNYYDLTSSYAYLKLVNAGNQSLTDFSVSFQVRDEIGGFISWSIINGTIVAGYAEAITYDSDVHKYLRIREASGTIYFDYSANGIDWVNFTSDTAVNYVIDPTSVLFQLYVAQGETPGATTVIFDNFNTIPDETAPVITLLGEAEVNVEVGSPYEDAGATALDETDGDITENIIVVNPVNPNIVGDYVVTYNVSDAALNLAIEVTRTVHVVDTTAPVITRLGEATVNLTVGDSYSDAGATASDNYGGDITGSIVTVNPVDPNTPGTYTVTYNVVDSSGNPATEVTRTVVVSAPVATEKKNLTKNLFMLQKGWK